MPKLCNATNVLNSVVLCNSVKNGAWRSLVARYFGVVEVVGSNPAAPIDVQRLGKGFGLCPVFCIGGCWDIALKFTDLRR
jgi:hypothetical protein